ncbi:glycoside hydrolase family 5 protein [Jaapia argillacea MUCL 33604]|uniref:Glycoside hydrolase family 5 protein n=1 Tax=Jaapia argillacea MUCL 33604 TaxID=933084 RepID=A0A067PWS8_9AGAM|nr:glycoside hydrolase family 5 protein [Jaapia argillacea MUCL 33604]
MFGALPGTLFLLTSLLLWPQSGFTEAQQCRLVLPTQVTVGGVAAPQNSPPANSTDIPTVNGTSVPQAFNYGTDKIRGVNLGGWFVLEPWITPSIFQNTNNPAIVDEYTFGQMQDYNTALGILQNHWNTWITEADFIAINAAGLNFVRIPLGYWSVPITSADTNFTTSVAPYIPGAWPYLLKALTWAKAHSVHVIIDLHGAPGSQNGFDNSGQRTGDPVWAVNPSNVSRTLDIISFMGKELGEMVDVIELLNEPAGFDGGTWAGVTRSYWENGYAAVRGAAGTGVKVMVGDAFLGVQAWNNFLTPPSANGVIMDNHQYQVFNNDQLAYSYAQHINYTCSLIPSLSSYAASNIWTITGEWSTAITDCAQWLNGRGVGARWDGSLNSGQGAPFGSCTGYTGSYQGFSSSYKSFLRQYWEAQADVGESVQGWVYWCWKNENADDWSYQMGLQGDWIPQDPTNRIYPNLCSGSS